MSNGGRPGWGLLALALALAPGCARNPATGERQLNFVGKGQEIKLGKQAAEEVAGSIGLYDDRALQDYVSGIGKAMAAVSERPDLPWSFQVVDDDAVNAFALPGGYLFVTRGILAHMENEAQLASVLGHEIGHVTGKHGVNRASKGMAGQVLLGLGMIFSESARRYGQVASAGMNVMFLKFSRDDEDEADTLGMRYALKTNYDVREMPGMFAVLQRVGESQGGGERLPEWLSTHPTPQSRIADTRKQIARLQLPPSGLIVDREKYLSRIQGIVYGPDPRHGFFEGDRLLHPEMRFSMTMPAGWKKANMRQAVVAASPAGDAMMQLTLSPAPSPQQALQAFFQQPGVQAAGAVPAMVQGLPSESSKFVGKIEQGEIAGVVTFVAHGGKVLQLLSFAAAPKVGEYLPAFSAAHGSFAPLTDPRALAAQPARLEIAKAPRAMTVADLYRERPAPVPVEKIALINQMEPGTALQAGQSIKWLRAGTAGAPPPASGAPPPSAPTGAPPPAAPTGPPPPAVPR